MVDFRVGIYSVKALPVYDTKKAGVNLHFNLGDEPQWLWTTRNQQGDLVASGLYFYAIYDNKDKVLAKGKLMVIR